MMFRCFLQIPRARGILPSNMKPKPRKEPPLELGLGLSWAGSSDGSRALGHWQSLGLGLSSRRGRLWRPWAEQPLGRQSGGSLGLSLEWVCPSSRQSGMSRKSKKEGSWSQSMPMIPSMQIERRKFSRNAMPRISQAHRRQLSPKSTKPANLTAAKKPL